MEKTEEKVWQIPNRFEAMAQAAREVFAWLSSHPISSRAKYSAGLAIEEMITNMIKYGYDDGEIHQIRFRIAIHPSHLEIVFEDDGHAFDPTLHPSPNVVNVINSPRIGGLGIELVRRVTIRMVYERVGNLNRNTLHIRRIEPGDTQPIRVTLPESAP